MAERIDVPEPASAALRRLHEEMTPPPNDCDYIGTCGGQYADADTPSPGEWAAFMARRDAARRANDAALPALADLVAAVEHEVPHEREPGHFCGSPLCRALAAVHAALEAK